MSGPGEKPADLAHEIRNSLSVIQNAAELLESRYQPEGREARFFRAIFEEIVRLMRLIEDKGGA